MHSSEFLMELVADPDYRQFPAYGIGGKSVHDYLYVFFYRADAVRQDSEGNPSMTISMSSFTELML